MSQLSELAKLFLRNPPQNWQSPQWSDPSLEMLKPACVDVYRSTLCSRCLFAAPRCCPATRDC
jgi:hypothetical protein